MSIYDEIPTTKQAIITFKTYCDNQYKACQNSMKKLEKFILECDRRLEQMEGKEK